MASLKKSLQLTLLGIFIYVPIAAWGQSSDNFMVSSNTFNSGGSPGNDPSPSSANYYISVVSVGEIVSASTLSSASFSMDVGFAAANRPSVAEVIFSNSFESADVLESAVNLSSKMTLANLRNSLNSISSSIAMSNSISGFKKAYRISSDDSEATQSAKWLR